MLEIDKRGYALSARELEALRLIGEGCSIGELAELMNVRPRTAKAYSDALRRKFKVSKRRELIPISRELFGG